MDKWFQNKYRVKIDNKMRYFGETDTKKKVIKINKRKSKSTGTKGELIDSINHEVQHAKHPHLSERQTEKRTINSTNKLSKKSKQKLYNLTNGRRKQINTRRTHA